MLPRLAVMLSGSGRTLVNLLDHIERGDLAAEVPLVIASREGLGTQRARERGVPRVLVIAGQVPGARLAELLAEHQIDWVVLAGYLKLVSIPPAHKNRVVNIHPALLPDFGGPGMYGRRVHEAVLAAGRTVSGCTVHLCDGVYDRGTIVLQKSCPVLPDDTPETLAGRVFALECEAYPEALKGLLEGTQAPRHEGTKAGKTSEENHRGTEDTEDTEVG